MAKVALMFLGGLPNPNEDSGQCWKRFLELSNNKYFHNIIFVIHPISKTDKIHGFWKEYLNTNLSLQKRSKINTIYITQENKHLRTAWATRSLVDVTIIMIKEAYNYKTTIEKFILIEGKTCPLYNLSVLYKTVTASRKNWFGPLNNSCKTTLEENPHPNMYCDESICLKEKDCSFWSQWMILDSKYIQSILDTQIMKSTETVQCNGSLIDQIIVPKHNNIDAKIVKHSLVEMLDVDQKPCTFADELYFGLYLKRKRTIKEFIHIIKTISLRHLYTTYKVIKPHDRKTVRYIDAPDNFFESSHYSHLVNPLTINSNYSRNIPLELKKYPFYIIPMRFNVRSVLNIFSVPPVYADWRYFNPSPFNIFRSFSYPGFAIKEYIGLENEKAINFLLRLRTNPNSSFESLGLSKIAYWTHPLEYNSDLASIYINGYNLLEYLHKINPQDSQFKYLRDIYPPLFKQSKLEVTYKKTRGYKFAYLEPSKILIGTYITSDVLNSARMRGCLFIRKCEKGSQIHLYAEQLYAKDSKYIYD